MVLIKWLARRREAFTKMPATVEHMHIDTGGFSLSCLTLSPAAEVHVLAVAVLNMLAAVPLERSLSSLRSSL